MPNRKKVFGKRVSSLAKYTERVFQIKFGKKSLANFSKGYAFLLPQHRFHCAVISLAGSAEVAAGFSNQEGRRGFKSNQTMKSSEIRW